MQFYIKIFRRFGIEFLKKIISAPSAQRALVLLSHKQFSPRLRRKRLLCCYHVKNFLGAFGAKGSCVAITLKFSPRLRRKVKDRVGNARSGNLLFFGQLGFILEAHDPPKSRPKPRKIDVENQHVFGINFCRVWTPFWKGFW